MRVWIALLLLPLAGCVGSSGDGVFLYTYIARGSPEPVSLGGCDELLDNLNQRAEDEAKVYLEMSVKDDGYYWPAVDFAEDGGMVANTAAGSEASSTSAPQVTGTNNQEVGVDEADILKTDGTWTYVFQDRLYILHSTDVGEFELETSLDMEGNYGNLLLDGDKLVAISQSWGGGIGASSGMAAESSYYAGVSMTHIEVFDVSDPTAPVREHHYQVEGDNVGARLVDGYVYAVVYSWASGNQLVTQAWPDDDDLKLRGLDWDQYYDLSPARQENIRLSVAREALTANKLALAKFTLDDHLPAVAEDGEPLPRTDAACRSVYSPADGISRGVNTIFSLNPDDGDHQAMQLLSGYPIVYGSLDSLVLASNAQDMYWYYAQEDLQEATNLHWFDYEGLDVTHRASGRVMGTVQDQFAVDVHDGELRVATTTGNWGRWWLQDPEPMQNHMVIFTAQGDRLVEKGSVTGFAEGERIWSARFTDDRAYIITFRNIDPLWVIDLETPRILGELEIPGVSTYIHPLGDALLAVGYGGREGGGLDWGTVEVSLFDVGDPTNPTRADLLHFGGNGEYFHSDALYEHKAFTYWSAIDKLAIPLAGQDVRYTWVEGEWEPYDAPFVGLKLIDVDLEGMKLTVTGEANQDNIENYYNSVQRSYFYGTPGEQVSVYSLSRLGMTAHDADTSQLQDAVRF